MAIAIESLICKSCFLKRIAELDGLRAIAIILVIVYHLFDYRLANISTSDSGKFFLANLGMTGVHLFFSISGFIITVLLIKEKDKAGDVNLKSFYKRRFFRIVPPLLAYLLVVLIFYSLQIISNEGRGIFFSAIFFTNVAEALGIIQSHNNWFTAHTWTLSVEEQYYLLFPPLFIYVLKFRKVITNLFLVLFYIFSFCSLSLSNYGHTLKVLTIFYQFRYIIAGVFVAINLDFLKLVIQKFRFVILALVVLVMLLPLLSSSKIISLTAAFFEPFMFGAVLVWVIQYPKRFDFLNQKYVQLIGLSSYSLYLWQQFFLGPSENYLYSMNLFFVLVCIGFATYLSYNFIEKPFIRIGKNLLRN